MQYHVYRRPTGRDRTYIGSINSTSFHCAVIFFVVIMVVHVQQLLRQQNNHQQTGLFMNTYLIRIVHAWTAPIKGKGQTSSHSYRYGTSIHTNIYFGIPSGTIGRLHCKHRLYDDDLKSSTQIIQQRISPLVRRRTVFDPKSSNQQYRIPVRLFATNEINVNINDDDDNAVTDDRDLYEYDETESNQWIVPNSIYIPVDRIGMKFVRSSGAGGQNVNKVSSCVQIRFHVLSADWMGPLEVRQRFFQQYKNTISKHDGVYHLESQVHRTQSDNRKDVVKKLEAAILQVWPRPKIRKLRVGLSARGKQKRREEKSKQSSKKEGRRNQRFDY